MSFDKIKAMRSAERFMSQGKFRAAISEYRKIVENDPKDFSTLNILGDLYVKGNDEKEAINCFTRVAEHYSKQGFAQKAIAIYNKISRLQPNSADVSAKLAHLYKQKGSFAEARTHFVALAEQYQSRGQTTQALEIWKQIAQLDPNNTEVYLKIAEFCLSEDQKDEAVKAYTEAGIRLANQNKYESALAAFSSALKISQYDLVALNGFVKAQIKLGNADEAASNLENILEEQPLNRDILYLLVDCYLDLNNPVEAEKAIIRLVEQEPSNYPKFLNLIELYVKNDDLDSAVRILSMSSEHLLAGGRHEEFLKWTNEVLAQNPEQVDSLRLLVRYYGWQRDETGLKNALERLAETARLQNAVDEERYALSQLVVILPHETAYSTRLQEINKEYGYEEETAVEVGAFVDQDLGVTQFPPAEPEVPLFETFAVINNEDETNGNSQTFLDSYNEFNSEISLSDTNDSYVFEESVLIQSESLNGNGHQLAGIKNFDVKTDDFFIQTQETKEIEVVLAQTDEGETFDSGSTVSDDLRLQQELESIEFYITQGYKELAESTLCALEAEFGERKEFTRLRETRAGSLAPQAENNGGRVEVIEAENLTENVKEDIIKEDIIAESKNEKSFDFLNDFRNDLGFEENELADDGDYDTHYHMAIAYKEMGLMEESIREFQDAINLVRVDDGTRRFFHCCNLLGHCFMERGMPNLALMWYRRALETPDLNDEEQHALLYEAGNAYEAGGEMPKAVEYFEQIYAANVDYRDVSERLENLRVNN